MVILYCRVADPIRAFFTGYYPGFIKFYRHVLKIELFKIFRQIFEFFREKNNIKYI
jgi:hypothetical protein